MRAEPDISWSSDRTIRIVLADGISAGASASVRSAHGRLLAAGIPGVLDLIPAYATVLITFDVDVLDPVAAEVAVRRALGAEGRGDESAEIPARTIEIPVCYGGEFGPDLADVAAYHGLSAGRVIEIHAGGDYSVSFLGFSPGFAYLAGLPASIHTPRLGQPRTRVPVGSVAIGGEQTGVYPRPSPGGWRIIGRTSLVMFDADRTEPALLRIGDCVRFVPVAEERMNSFAGAER